MGAKISCRTFGSSHREKSLHLSNYRLDIFITCFFPEEKVQFSVFYKRHADLEAAGYDAASYVPRRVSSTRNIERRKYRNKIFEFDIDKENLHPAFVSFIVNVVFE